MNTENKILGLVSYYFSAGLSLLTAQALASHHQFQFHGKGEIVEHQCKVVINEYGILAQFLFGFLYKTLTKLTITFNLLCILSKWAVAIISSMINSLPRSPMKNETKPISLPLFFVPKIVYLFILLAVLFLLTSCAPKTNFDLRGIWEYTMIDTAGNTYDTGTITFDGKAHKGTYLQLNIYDVEYIGEFSVSGDQITLSGYENWEGAFSSENTISGTWQHENDSQGSFEAIRK